MNIGTEQEEFDVEPETEPQQEPERVPEPVGVIIYFRYIYA